MAAARIRYDLQEKLYLGNLNAQRDWGYAGDYVEGMWLMLQQEKPDDYILATGKTFSVREFTKKVFTRAGIDLDFKGTGVDEKGYDVHTGKVLVEVDPRYFRPTEVDQLLGDPSKAEKELGWKPTISFEELVNMMVDHDLSEVKKDVHLVNGGFEIKNYLE